MTRAALLLFTLGLAPSASAQSPWTRLGTDLVEPNAFHGMGLAIEGDTVLAGAPHRVSATPGHAFDPSDLDPPGSVIVYGESGGSWSIRQRIVPASSVPGDLFGVAVALDGDLAFVGAPNALVNGMRCGAVYRYERVAGQWVERQRLVASSAQDFGGFGNYVAFDGQSLVVGANLHTDAGITEWGRGFVFEEDASGAWVETGQLVPPAMPDESWAGYRVAIDGDRAALGVYGDSPSGRGAGAVCIFQETPQGWVPVQQVLPQRGTIWSHFSFSLILEDDLLIAGSIRGGVENHYSGSVHVFRHDGTSFVEVQEILPPGAEFGSAFGEDASLDENGRLLVGVPGADGIGGRIAIYAPQPDGTFELESVQWPPQTQRVDCFGWKVQSDGGRIAATALVAFVSGDRRGVVYVWDPEDVGTEVPRCHGSAGASGGPQEVLLRSRGRIAAGASSTELVLNELPPGATSILVGGTPNGVTDVLGFGCIGAPRVRLSPATAANGAGVVTWSLSTTSVGGVATAGSTWSFQAWARGANGSLHSNALDLRFEP